MANQLAFLVDLTYCTGCMTCRVACKDFHDLPVGVDYIKVSEESGGAYEQVGQGWRSRVWAYRVPFPCAHCEAPACREACPEGAIVKREEDGLVYIAQELCSSCGACVDCCPFEAIVFNADAGEAGSVGKACGNSDASKAGDTGKVGDIGQAGDADKVGDPGRAGITRKADDAAKTGDIGDTGKAGDVSETGRVCDAEKTGNAGKDEKAGKGGEGCSAGKNGRALKVGKCDFCRDRLDRGKAPICVDACPMRALSYGRLDQLLEENGAAITRGIPGDKDNGVLKPAIFYLGVKRG